jgi:hypothetical protein
MKTTSTSLIGRMTLTVVTTLCLAAAGMTNPAYGAAAGRAEAAIWSGDRLYDVILTDAFFNSPPPHSTDIIFSFADSGLMGQRSVSEAAPGDRDYNGGRWEVMAVVFTPLGLEVHDPDGDGVVNFELTHAEAVLEHAILGHLVIQETGI